MFRKEKLTSGMLLTGFPCLMRGPWAGIFQLLTPHHHLRTLAPKPRPLNLEDRFKCRQPLNTKVQRRPCAKHSNTWSLRVIHATWRHDLACSMLFRYVCSRRRSGSGGIWWCLGTGRSTLSGISSSPTSDWSRSGCGCRRTGCFLEAAVDGFRSWCGEGLRLI